MKRIYALSILFTFLLILAGCSARLTTEKAQEGLNKWMTDYPGSVEVQSVYSGAPHLTYGKLKFNNFVYRDDARGELKDFSGEGTALFVKENADWVLDNVWVGEQAQISVINSNSTGKNGASDSDGKADEKVINDDIKILAQGNFSPVGSPFFVIARDALTYAALREITSGLPEIEADYFKSNTIVAAFLGGCRTGGYSVGLTRIGRNELKADSDVLSVREIVNQGLTQPTQPYRVVSVPLGENQAIDINDWMSKCENARFFAFDVTSGGFETGNFAAAQTEKFQFGGLVNLERQGKFVTLDYYFAESGGQERKLSGKATGILQPDGKFVIAPISAGTFIKQPNSQLRITGKFPGSLGVTALKTEGVSDLSLLLESLPTKVSGSFSGKGKLEAKESEPQ